MFPMPFTKIGVDAADWTVMNNTLGNQLEHLEKGARKHLKVPSPIFEHQSNTGHSTSVENFSVTGRG